VPFRNYVSCHVHQQSLDSASTPDAFLDRELELGTGALVTTDHGTLGACRKVYDLAHDKKATKGQKIIPILGLEAYLRDDDCSILKAAGIPKRHYSPTEEAKEYALYPNGTFKEYIKYHHVTMHALDYEAYACMVRLLSKADGRAERHGSERKPLFSWSDLEELGGYNTTMTTGCLIGAVQRHLLDHDNLELATAYYERLRGLVKPGNFFVEVFPHKCDMNWVSGVFLDLEGGKKQKYYAGKRLRTNVGELSAEELAEAFARKDNGGHTTLIGVCNSRVWEDLPPRELVGVRHIEDFMKNECRPWAVDGDVQKGLNRVMMMFAKKYGDKILVADDSHFATPAEKVVQDVRLAQSGNWRFSNSYHRQSSEESFEHFKTTLGVSAATFESWVENSHEWADRFKDFKFDSTVSLPTKFYEPAYCDHAWHKNPKIPERDHSLMFTMELIKKHGRMDWKNKAYVERLQAEIELLHNNGTIDLLPYFFIGEECCSLYESKGLLTGPGRGSAAGLLLTYLLGITHVDPLKYNLSMDRFLTLDRVRSGKLPDIDQDLPQRELLNTWLQERFGDHQAQLSVDITLKLRMAVKDTARFLHKEVPPDIEAWTRKFVMPPQGVDDYDFVMGKDNDEGYQKGSIESGHKDTDVALQEYVKRYPEDWKIVQKCLGLARSKGRHACAVVIANKPISEFIPMTTVSEMPVTSYTSASVEAVGGLKMDFLTVNSLNDLGDAIKLIQSRSGMEIPASTTIGGKRVPGHRLVPLNGKLYDIWDLPEDAGVFADVATGKTETVFQFNTPAAKQWLSHFSTQREDGSYPIDSVASMAAFTALDRPGPLDILVLDPDGDGRSRHNMLVEYARRARGATGSSEVLEIFDELVPETYGVMCIAKGSVVRTGSGLVPIEDVRSGSLVQTETGEFHPVLEVLQQGIKDTVRIRMTNGEELRTTSDHQILTARGWIEAGKLTKTDIVKQFWVSDEPIEEGDDRDWLIGLLLADGDICACTPNIACSSKDFADRLVPIANAAFGLDSHSYKAGRCWYVALRHRKASGTTPNPLTRYLTALGLRGATCYTKRLPNRISKAMLAGFFEGDGSTLNKRIRICNKALAHDIFVGLQRARIHSAFYEDEPGVWTVSVRGPLPLRIKKSGRPDVVDFVPTPLCTVPRSDNDRQLLRRPFLGRSSAKRLERYGAVVDGGIWGKVLSVKSDTPIEVYDLVVDEVHSFVVGGSVVHNCYQEQLQRVYQQLTGCTGPEAEEFRTNVAKKKKEKVDAAYPGFIEHAGAKIGKKNAEDAWQFFKTWAQYGFNKSHAVCYATIGYACAFLKHHYPLEWWTSVLKNADKNEINEKFWRHCGHLIDLPDVVRSGSGFEIQGERIQAPLSLLQGVGEVAHAQLHRYRPYTDIKDFVRKQEQHCIDTGTKVTKTKKKTIKVPDPAGGKKKVPQEIEETVTELKRGHSALNRKIVYTLILSGAMESLFPKTATDIAGNTFDVTVSDQLRMYEEAIAEIKTEFKPNPKKGVKKPVSTEPVDPQYTQITPLARFQMRKAILPAYAENLIPLLAKVSPRVTMEERDCFNQQGNLSTHLVPIYVWTPSGTDYETSLRVLSCQEFEEVNTELLEPGSKLYVSVAAYIESAKTFTYGEERKTACKLMLDIDGGRFELVKWPGKDGRLAAAFKQPLEGSVSIVTMVKFKNDRPFSIDDIEVLQPAIDMSKKEST